MLIKQQGLHRNKGRGDVQTLQRGGRRAREEVPGVGSRG